MRLVHCAKSKLDRHHHCHRPDRSAQIVDDPACQASVGIALWGETANMHEMWPAGGFGYLAYKRPRLATVAGGGLAAFTILPAVSATARATFRCSPVPAVHACSRSMLADRRHRCLQAAASVVTVNRFSTLLGQHAHACPRFHQCTPQHTVCCKMQALHIYMSVACRTTTASCLQRMLCGQGSRSRRPSAAAMPMHGERRPQTRCSDGRRDALGAPLV